MAENATQQLKKLNAPTEISCLEAEEDSITISWKPVKHAAGYVVLCKDALEESWENCESVIVSKEETTAKITHLWPTATFTIKVIATAGDKEHTDSDDSEIFYCDTAVGSCAPKKRKCLGLC